MSLPPAFLKVTVDPFFTVTVAGENPASPLYETVTVAGVVEAEGLAEVLGDALTLVDGLTVTDTVGAIVVFALAVGDGEVSPLPPLNTKYPPTTTTTTTINPIINIFIFNL